MPGVDFGLVRPGWRRGDSRIKDIADIEGVRHNQLVGYGLVVGLNGTGDTLNNRPSPSSPCKHAGAARRQHPRRHVRTANVAAVMVTANLPAFATQGHAHRRDRLGAGRFQEPAGRHAAGDAAAGRRRRGLRRRPGLVAIGGFQAEGDAAKIARGVPTVGRIANGAMIEREIDFAINRLNSCAWRCAIPTSPPRAASPRRSTTSSVAAPPSRTDPSTVALTVPSAIRGNMVELLTEVEQLQVEPDQPARIIIDERSGVIVMGETCASPRSRSRRAT